MPLQPKEPDLFGKIEYYLIRLTALALLIFALWEVLKEHAVAVIGEGFFASLTGAVLRFVS